MPDPRSDTVDPSRGVRNLHTSLLVGQIVLAGVLAFVRWKTGLIIEDMPSIGLWMAGLAAISIAVAAWVLRSRLPRREPGITTPAFWTQATMSKAILLWFVVEGATVFSLVGYFLTGVPAAAAIALAGVLLFAWLRPAYFESR
jgi:hypothetical protein